MSALRNLKRRSLTKRYLSLRKRYGYKASQALHYARQPEIKPLDWNNNVDKAEWTEKGFSLIAKVEIDANPDYSYMGEFSTDWSPWKVDPSEAGDDRIYPVNRRRYSSEPTAVYFHPAHSYQSHFESLRATFSKSESDTLARSYVYQDMKRLRALHLGNWTYVGIVVTAYKKGIKLGNCSLWGIESYSRNTPGFDPQTDSEAYFTEVARDCASEAIDQAESALASLCARRER